MAADAQAWSVNGTFIDCVANGSVGGACAFGAHVALGGEAGEKIVACGECGENGALRDGFLDGLQIFRAGMQEKVDVRVDEAGQQSGVAEIDELRFVRVRHMRADFHDEFALNQNFAGRDGATGFDVEQVCSVKDNGTRRGSGLGYVRLRMSWRHESCREVEGECCECCDNATSDHVLARDNSTLRVCSGRLQAGGLAYLNDRPPT